MNIIQKAITTMKSKSREIEVTPIRKNPRIGKATENDASVVIGGSKPDIITKKAEIFSLEFNKEDLFGHPFSDSYKDWIIKHVNDYIKGASIKIEEYRIEVTAKSIKDLSKVAMFIGYAYGQQDNGR